MAAPLVLVIFSLYSHEETSPAQTLSLSNLAHRSYEPALITPVEVGSRIDFNSSGGRVVPNGGVIRFELNENTRPYLGYRWIGSSFEVRTGNEGDDIQSMATAYVGKVTGISHDLYTATVQITDNRPKLDKPVERTFYDDDDLPAIANRPQPLLIGKRNSIEPVLEDEATWTYRITEDVSPVFGDLALTINELRVGGVPWDFAASSPSPGQYTYTATNGTFTLGGEPSGEIRVDAEVGAYTTADILVLLATAAGCQIEAGAADACDAIAPYEIGFYLGPDPINYQDLMDQVAAPQLCFWGFTDAGSFTVGALERVSTRDIPVLDKKDIRSLRLVNGSPPAYRVTVEHSRNQSPATQFFDSVPQSERQQLSSPGVAAEIYDATVISPDFLTAEPQALDLPIIRSLVNTDADALAIRTRAANLWTNTVYSYDVEVERTDIALYDNIAVDYIDLPVYEFGTIGSEGNFRVYGILKRFGGGPNVVNLRIAPPLTG